MTVRKKFFDIISSKWLAAGSRNRYVALTDIVFLCMAVYLGYALRLTFFIKSGYRDEMLVSMALFSSSVFLALYIGRIYNIFWPQASVEEYARLFRWYCAGAAAFMLEVFFIRGYVGPRSSITILTLFGFIFISGIRASWRFVQVTKSQVGGRKERAVIIGAGEAGALLARDLLRHNADIQPVGFIDRDPEKTGMIIASLEVLGDMDSIADVVRDKGVTVALIAIPSASGAEIGACLERISPLGISVRVLPSLQELADGRVAVSRLRSVKLEDLLRRERVKLDDEGISSIIRGRRVLVTGAGGSIGSEICRQVLRHSPAKLLTLGHGEQSIYNLMESLSDKYTDGTAYPIIADVADATTMTAVFREFKPDVVFHAAAHKHVPLMEYNPREALRVNALGTQTLAELAGRSGVRRFVMISTDKAVNPSSVMGATKRIAERLLFNAQKEYPETKYMVVRFGNVLGSRGSVVPKFETQIERGGPVTVTHRDMERYFMLIPEAVSLVLQAGTMGEGGELYVLDMGKPVKITEMAETLIRLHGHEPYKDIEIVFTGIRPGEKLYEELFYDPDHVKKTGHDKIFLSSSTKEHLSLMPQVRELLDKSAARAMTAEELRGAIIGLCKEKTE